MIDLYTWATPNGRKASIMLEECGLPYRVVAVDLLRQEQLQPAFLAVNPNGKIPAIVDHDAGETVFESSAIVHYLACRTGRLLPADPGAQRATMKWFLWQAGAFGPSIGMAYFVTRRAPDSTLLVERLTRDTARLLGVLDAQLAGNEHVAGRDYTIADVMAIPWAQAGLGVIAAAAPALAAPWPHVRRWLAAVAARPAVVRGLAVPAAA
jgi:GST-like protein